MADAETLEKDSSSLVDAVDARLSLWHLPDENYFADEVPRIWDRACEAAAAMLNWLSTLSPLSPTATAIARSGPPAIPSANRGRTHELRTVRDAYVLTADRRTGQVDLTTPDGDTYQTYLNPRQQPFKLLWCLADPQQPHKTSTQLLREAWPRRYVDLRNVKTQIGALKKLLRSQPQNRAIWLELRDASAVATVCTASTCRQLGRHSLDPFLTDH